MTLQNSPIPIALSAVIRSHSHGSRLSRKMSHQLRLRCLSCEFGGYWYPIRALRDAVLLEMFILWIRNTVRDAAGFETPAAPLCI